MPFCYRVYVQECKAILGLCYFVAWNFTSYDFRKDRSHIVMF